MMKNKIFWHVTPIENIDNILKNGIYKSDDGNIGEGVYCIFKLDLHSLESVLAACEDMEYKISELCIVEFNYAGEYRAFTPESQIFKNIVWIKIPEAIHAKNINKSITLTKAKKH